jgi:hypothetical protein
MIVPQRDDWKPELAAAVVTGTATAIATAVSGELTVWMTALVTLLASVGGWCAARVITHRDGRSTNTALAVILAVAAVGAVVRSQTQCAPEGVLCFVGGCDAYSVYAQNRYQPLGAAARTEPRRAATQVGSFSPNELVPVDGWVRSQVAYPHNSPPFDSDVWFHLADDSGWVSFAGVRADPTTPAEDPYDPDGGRPAPIPEECSGTFR